MSTNVFTLDALREEADKEFAPFKVPLSDGTEVTLKNLLRLNTKVREAVLGALDALNSDEDQTVEGIDGLISTATKIIDLVSDANGKKLIREIDGDIALLLTVIKAWMGETQLGEAESSPA
jgi:hypothetical protein